MKRNITNILGIPDCRAKRREIWHPGVLVDHIGTCVFYIFCLFFQFVFLFFSSWVVRCTCLKMACNFRPEHRTASLNIDHIWCTVDLEKFNVIWEFFGAPASKLTVTWKHLVKEYDSLKFGVRVCTKTYMVTFYVVVFKAILESRES